MASASMATHATYSSLSCWFFWFHTSQRLGPSRSITWRGQHTFRFVCSNMALPNGGLAGHDYGARLASTDHDIEVILLSLEEDFRDAI